MLPTLNPTQVVYSGPFNFIEDRHNFTKLRSYLLIIELFGDKCDINRLLHQRSIEKCKLPRRPAHDYGEQMTQEEDKEIGPVDFLLPEFPQEFGRSWFNLLSLEEQENIVRENYRMYTRNGLTTSSLSFEYWNHMDFHYRCIICRAIDGLYSSIGALLGFRFLNQLLAIGFRDLIKSLLGSTLAVVVQFNILPNAERQPDVSITFVQPTGAPRFSAIDWERCLLQSIEYSILCAHFSHFRLCAFDVKDEYKAPIESLAAAVQRLVDVYESPLTLQQLARLTVRETVSGPQFEKRMRSLPIPPRLLDFLIFADELLSA